MTDNVLHMHTTPIKASLIRDSPNIKPTHNPNHKDHNPLSESCLSNLRAHGFRDQRLLLVVLIVDSVGRVGRVHR